ncbi:MAG TPA: tyrosine-type recombinase/integrase [Solirubrobacteraceae bacterium]|jgi:integrase|nr:tyrosine-type recombinase/integrase [Solirubrobacteraceae bacterium]
MPGHVRARGKRADGTTKWQARYTDPTDQLRRIEKTFRTKNEAQDWLTQQQASVLRGEHQDPRRADRPFADAVAAWRETRLPTLAPKTRDRYEDVLRLHLEPEFGRVPLTALTREVVKRYFARLQREGRTSGREHPGDPLSAGSIRKIQTVLSSVLSEAVEMGMIRVNPAMRMRLPAPAKGDMTILTAAEVRCLADAVDQHYRVAILLAANTGMRAGELWALRRRDVDLLRGVIHLRQSVKRDTAAEDAPKKTVDAYGREVGPPKSGKARNITLGQATKDMLAEHLTKPVPGGAGPDAAVFLTPTGKAIRHTVFMRRVFGKALKALPADKRKLRFHDLRHSCASLLVAEGAPMLYVKERLGHASVTTTINLYGHMFPSVEASLADALDGMYEGPVEGPQPAPTPLRPAAMGT